MDVETFAEMRLAHRRAFDMPARPAAAPRAVPAGHIRSRRLPQHKIGGIVLVGRHLDARAGDHLVAAAAGEPPVTGVGGDREQHVAFGDIGVAAGDQALDHRDHLRDMLGRPRLDIGRQAAQCGHVVVKRGDGAFGQRGDRLAILAGGVDDLVVDIGDVADIADVVLAVDVAQHPIKHVEHDNRPRHCRYGRSRTPSARTHTSAPAGDRAARRAPCGGIAYCRE